MNVFLKVMTVVSLAMGLLVLVPWVGIIIANIMALAGMDASDAEAGWKVAVPLLFVVMSSLWPLSLLASMGLSIWAWIGDSPQLALLLSLIWLAWALVCALLFAAWAALI